MNNMKWIKCKNELPSLGDYSVLAYFDTQDSVDIVHVEDYFKDITAGLDSKGNQLYSKWYKSENVTHWAELPLSPQGKDTFRSSR